MQTTTSAAVQEIGACASVKPEWLRIPDAIRVSGIGRSSLYNAIKSREIKSVCVRKRNCIRGIRLISSDSLSAYIESFADAEAQ